MDGAGGDDAGLIRRRHVLYVEGYDPQGAEGYYGLFGYAVKRFLKHWPVKATLGPLLIDSEAFAHWTVETAAPNWQVATRIDFLRQEQAIRANMALPLWRQAPRAVWWATNYLLTGTIFRILRASPQFGLALLYFQLLMLLWLVAAAAGGAIIGRIVMAFTDGPVAFAVAAGLLGAVVCFRLLRPVADFAHTVQINNHWPYLIEYGRGDATCFDPFIEAGAQRLVEMAKANEADEIVVVGHSGGAILAPAIVARALELDRDVGRRGPRVVMLTPGSIMPAIGLHPRATRVRRDIKRVAVEPSVTWVHVFARADVLNFNNFDPVSGIGIDAGPARCNPVLWPVRFRDMMDQSQYDKNRWNLFRLHYQFIMGNDMRAPYDYPMLVCGPVPVVEWARLDRAMLERFAADGSYAPAVTPASAPGSPAVS